MKLKGYDVLPCPFCGGLALHIEGTGSEVLGTKSVVCGNIKCNAEGPYALGVSGAIDKWNTRMKEEKEDKK